MVHIGLDESVDGEISLSALQLYRVIFVDYGVCLGKWS
jgi:hypothetical protein